MSRGIVAAGVHLPRFRIKTSTVADAWGVDHAPGIDRKAVPAADEDSVTMAVAAGRDAIERAAIEPSALTFLGFATTNPPLSESELGPRLVRALGTQTDVQTVTATTSPLTGLDVLRRAIAADGPALAVAADTPTGDPPDADHPLGAAGVAFVVDDDSVVTLDATASYADEYPGVRYRRPNSGAIQSIGVRTYEREAVGKCVTSVLTELGADDPMGAVLHQPNGRLPYRIAKRAELSTQAIARGIVVDRVGDAGAATVPLGLVKALTEANSEDSTVAVDFGGGAAALGLMFNGTLAAAPSIESHLTAGDDVSYSRYLRERGYVAGGSVAGGGAHVSLPSWRRSLDGRYRMIAGRCPACENMTFPAEGACGRCQARVSYERVPLSTTGTVTAVTVIGQGGAPPEFVPQQERDGPYAVAIVQFPVDGSDRDATESVVDSDTVTVPMQLTDCEPDTVSIGDKVRTAVRRVYEDEGIPRYGTKAIPL